MARRNGDKQEEAVAVAIDKDKGSQYALRWAVDRSSFAAHLLMHKVISFPETSKMQSTPEED